MLPSQKKNLPKDRQGLKPVRAIAASLNEVSGRFRHGESPRV